MALLNRQDMVDALAELGRLANYDGEFVELLVVGGGIMVMEFASRMSTRDLDGVVTNSIEPAKVRSYAAKIAVERNWPLDWLNDGAKGFLNGPTTATVVYESVGITVYRPAYEQLLAMKLCAWRDDVDISDARRIAAELPKNREETWRLVEPFLESREKS